MDSSHLSRLSPELRNVIYEFVFISRYAVTLQSGSIQHDVTKTCRQIRQETLSMYHNLTRFNAHLDDGPATRLAIWLKTLGPYLTLATHKINVWDLHNLNGTLYGTESAEKLLRQERPPYVLRRTKYHKSWYLTEVVIALQSMDLDLARFCIVDESCSEGASRVKLTSEFAIVKLGEDLPAEVSETTDGGIGAQSEMGVAEVCNREAVKRLAS